MEFDKARTSTLNKGMDGDSFKQKMEADERKGNYRKKNVLTEQELFEAQQLIRSGVLPVEQYPTYDPNMGMLAVEETEEETEVSEQSNERSDKQQLSLLSDPPTRSSAKSCSLLVASLRALFHRFAPRGFVQLTQPLFARSLPFSHCRRRLSSRVWSQHSSAGRRSAAGGRRVP